jgi:hypothetical protein
MQTSKPCLLRSWLCENAKTRDGDRRSYSSKTALAVKRASELNLPNDPKNVILAAFQSLSIESRPSLRFCAPTQPWTFSRKAATSSTGWCFNTRSIPFRSRVRSQPSRRNACLPTRNVSARPTNSSSTPTSRAIGGRRTSFDGLPFVRSKA